MTLFSEFANILDIIESTTGRNESIDILKNFFSKNVNNLIPAIYLLNCKIYPDYLGLEMGVGHTIINKLAKQTSQKSKSSLTLQNVLDNLRQLVTVKGKDSASKKRSILQKMIETCTPTELKYLVRIIADGTLRVGLASTSILTALAYAFKYNDQVLIQAYHQYPNYEHLIQSMFSGKQTNATLLTKCKITPSIPFYPMLSTPVNSFEQVLNLLDSPFTCEYKLDGERAQWHVTPSFVNVFSRRLQNNTDRYMNMCNILKKNVLKNTVQSIILDSEIVAFDEQTNAILPFQILLKKKNIAFCVFIFDILYLNGQPLLEVTLEERRKLMYKHISPLKNKFMFVPHIESRNIKQIKQFFNKALENSCEGLMYKLLNDTHNQYQYQIAHRSTSWLKMKKDYLHIADTFDLVVIGGYLGKGRRETTYGAYLLACYNKQTQNYESITKVGSGFTQEELHMQWNTFKKLRITSPLNNYLLPKTDLPNHFFKPVIVFEITGAELTLSNKYSAARDLVRKHAAFSIRAPRFFRQRDDKSPKQATSTQQLIQMYQNIKYL